jgi:DNA-binding SARP family transcriptional activator/DNA-binding beta-propeller fold protein YncE
VVEFGILGSLQVVREGSPVPLGGHKQRILLALLVTNANRVVATDRLIDTLWGERLPVSAANMLQGHVSHLRRSLGDNGTTAPSSLEYAPPGYVLRLSPEQLDAQRFELLLTAAKDHRAAGDAREAVRLLEAGLALWRGPALADLADVPELGPEITRLEELRLHAIEEHIDAELECGRHGELVPQLRSLVQQHPLRERFHAQLMLALYRAGRQAEALTAYRDTHRRLRDELGVEPTAELRELERAILQHDPALTPPRASQVPKFRRRGTAFAAAAALAVAAALGAGFSLWSHGARPTAEVLPNSVAVVDTRTDRLVDDIRTGRYPGPVAATSKGVWVGNIADNTMTRIDPATREASSAQAVMQPLDLALATGRIWIANGTDYSTNPPTGGGTVECRGCVTRRRKIVDVGRPRFPYEWAMAVAGGGTSIWASSTAPVTLQLDAVSGRLVRRIEGVGGACAVGFGSVWVADYYRHVVARIDPRTGAVIARIPITSDPTRIAVGAGSVWVTTQHPSAVWRVDPRSDRIAAVIPVPATARRVAVGAGFVWVTSGTYAGEPGVPQRGGVVSKIDPHANRVVATIKLGWRPDGVAIARGLVWIAVAPRH